MPLRARDERGLSESTQWAVLFTLLMLVTLGLIQAGIVLHGRNVAQRAATAAGSSTGTSWRSIHQVRARYMAPVSR